MKMVTINVFIKFSRDCKTLKFMVGVAAKSSPWFYFVLNSSNFILAKIYRQLCSHKDKLMDWFWEISHDTQSLACAMCLYSLCQARALISGKSVTTKLHPQPLKGVLLLSWGRQVGNFSYLVLWELFLKGLTFSFFTPCSELTNFFPTISKSFYW